MIREVDFGTVVPGKHQGVFVAVTAWARVWAEHHAAKSGDARDARYLYPLVLMMQRWDGAIGFPGGKVDPGETDLLAAGVREGFEEAGISLVASDLSPVCAHEADRIVVNLLHVEAGRHEQSFNLIREMSMDFLREILRNAASARDAIAEGSPFWAHLADYGKGQGWRKLRDSNMLSTAVGEELDAVRAAMYANAPDGAWREAIGDAR